MEGRKKKEELQQAQLEINVLSDRTKKMDKEPKYQKKVAAGGQMGFLKSKMTSGDANGTQRLYRQGAGGKVY